MKKLVAATILSLGILVAGCGNSQGARDCEAAGGKCGGVSDCDKGKGFLGDYDCSAGASVACCFDRCGGVTEDFQCCSSGATFRPVCHDGKLVCAAGQNRC